MMLEKNHQVSKDNYSKADGQAFKPTEVKKSAGHFSHGLDFNSFEKCFT